MRPSAALSLATLFALTGCSGYATRSSNPAPVPLAERAPAVYERPCAAPPADARAAFECDRRSILAMAGEYRVRFAFDETAALTTDYAPHAAQRSGGTELIEIIADEGNRISLQHILVLGKEHVVVKHWRQDWRYEPTRLLRFRGNGRFESEATTEAQRGGAWSQTVYEVDDAPRYAGIGRWRHDQSIDAWESDRTWRPLPRREYSKRKDYQALEVVNRHTLTPAGWVHEQDNTKLALDASGAHAIAREHGINSYTHVADYDFSAGRDYWRRTSGFWSDVRSRWAALEVANRTFTTAPEPDGEDRIDQFFKLADRVGAGQAIAPAQIDALFARYIHTDGGTTTAY